MKNSLYYGKGVYYFENGVRYIGDFENNYFHGDGVKIRPDGTKIYEGSWYEDEYHGYGSRYDKSGRIAGKIQSVGIDFQIFIDFKIYLFFYFFDKKL